MRILVVGGAGFIGSHLVERLLADGHAVDVVDDLSTGSLGNLADARSLPGELKIHNVDATVEAFGSLAAMRGPDVIYHLAALPAGPLTAAVCGRAVQSTMAVFDAARHLGPAKVVLAVSAGALYGDVPAKELPVKEGRPWSPVGVRGVVARTIVDLAETYRATSAVEFTVLAMTSVYGARQRRDGGVVAAFAAALADGVAPRIHGDGRQTRDLLYIDDAVDALARAASRGGGLVINIGTGVSTPVRDLWQAMAGPGAPIPELVARMPADVQRMAVSPTRARIHLAWAPWTDVATGLRSLR